MKRYFEVLRAFEALHFKLKKAMTDRYYREMLSFGKN